MRRGAPLAVTLVTLMVALAPTPGWADPPAAAGQPLIAAVPGVFPPQYSFDKAGKPTGFAVEVMNRIAARIGRVVRYRVYSTWKETLEALENGDAEIIPNVGITKEREQDFDFTLPVETFAISIFVRKGTPDIEDLDDLAGQIAGAVEKNVAVKLLSQNPQIRLRVFPSAEEAIFHLLSGQIDAIVYPAPVLAKLLHEAGLDDKVKVVGEPLIEIKRAMAVRKGDPALVTQLDGAISEFLNTDEFRALYAKWHGISRHYWTGARVAWTMGILVLGTAILMMGWRFISVSRLNRKLRTQIAERELAIAQRERFQKELVDSEARFRDLIEGSIQGIFVIRDHKLLFANAAYARIHGYASGEEILALDTIEPHYAPQEYPRILQNKAARLRGDPVPVQYEYEGRTKDGAAIWLESHNRRIAWDGEPAIQVTLFDVTRRKQAEEEQKRLATAIEQAADGIVVTDSEGRIQYVNRAYERMTGYSRSEAIGQKPSISKSGRHDDSFYREMWETITRGDVWSGQVTNRRKDGTLCTVEMSISPMHDNAGAILGYIGVKQDISARTRAEARFAAIIANSLDVIVVVNAEARFQLVSPSVTAALGYLPEALLGQEVFTLMHPDDVPQTQQTLASVLQAPGTVAAVEFRLRHQNGTWRHFDVVGTNLLDDPAVGGVLGTMRDTTERKEGEERAREREVQLSSIYDTVADIIFQLAVEENGEYRFVSINKMFQDVTGLAPSQVLGNSVRDIIPEPSLSLVLQKYGEAIREKKIVRWEETSHYPTGDLVGEVSIAPIFNDAGICTHLVGAVHDVTASRQAETTKHALEQRARLLVDSMPHALLIANRDGQITDVNSNTVDWFGYPREELIGQNVEMLIPGHLREGHVGLRTAYVQDPEARTRSMGNGGGLIGLRRDGSELPLDITLSPIRTEHGLEIICAMEDATERRYLQAQLVTSQKMETVGRLAGGVAHDFNNMLAVILSHAEFLLDEVPKEDSKFEDVQEIITAANRSAALTRQLLAFSRQQLLKLEQVDLNDVVAGMEKMLRRLIGEDVNLTTRLESELGMVKADAGQLEQVLMNLAVNARDAMPLGGELSLETSNAELDEAYANGHITVQPGSYVMMAVSDTGTGMDEATRLQVFEPFFTTKELGKGTGLGLSTVYGIVKQLGGSIWVYSELEHGTTFKIYLPRYEGGKVMPLAESPETGVKQGHETIMVVEDEVQVGKAAKRILESAGYSVLAATNGAEAISLAEDHTEKINLVLTDVIMPGMSGAELVDHLQNTLPTINALFMTGYTDGAISQHGILKEGVNVLFKPFTRASLLEQVRQILDKA